MEISKYLGHYLIFRLQLKSLFNNNTRVKMKCYLRKTIV